MIMFLKIWTLILWSDKLYARVEAHQSRWDSKQVEFHSQGPSFRFTALGALATHTESTCAQKYILSGIRVCKWNVKTAYWKCSPSSITSHSFLSVCLFLIKYIFLFKNTLTKSSLPQFFKFLWSPETFSDTVKSTNFS